MSVWTTVFALRDLPVGARKLHTAEGVAIAVFRLEDEQLYAIDNRCPHEGYPLTQGALKGCTLTCSYHNFKFDLRTGDCLMGDERVGVWPVRVYDGRVQLDLRPPDRSATLPERWLSLQRGLADDRIGQVARDVVRLLDLGVQPAQIAAFGAAHDATFGKWGSSHGLPVMRDVLCWLELYPGLQAAYPLSQGLAQVGRGAARRPAQELAPALAPGDVETFADRLSSMVEDEDMPGSIGMIRGALGLAWREAELRPAMLRVVSDHFLDFGHCLIYVNKAFELLELAGWEHAEAILCGLTRTIVNGTREDTLPKWSRWTERMAQVEPNLDGWARQTGHVEVDVLAASIVDGGVAHAFAAVEKALISGASALAVSHALCLAAAQRMLRFRIELDADPTFQDSWLSVSHNLTFCSAVRQAAEIDASADVVRLLFQGVHFVAGNRKLDGPAVLWGEPVGSVDDILGAVGDHRPDFAAALVGMESVDELEQGLMRLAMHDPLVRAIYVTHVIKLIVAGFADARAIGRVEPVRAVVRMLASPHQERRVMRLVGEAIDLVQRGQIPTRLGL